MTGRIAIGIDIGGTKIAAVALDLQSGAILMRDEIPTLRLEGGERVFQRLEGLIAAMAERLAAQDLRPVGIGIGVPELIDNAGAIRSHWNFDWDERDIAADLSGFGVVRLESDARTVALAELVFGNGRHHPSFVFVTIGSGLSFSFCNDGVIHRGANGYAIHFGSSDIMAVCKACGAQEGFNLEALASGRGLSTTYFERTGQHVDTHVLLQPDAEPDKKQLIDQATTALGSYLGQLVNIFDPHAVIVGGGLGMNASFFAMLDEKTRPHIWAEDCRNIPISTSAFSKDGAAIGAALLFRN